MSSRTQYGTLPDPKTYTPPTSRTLPPPARPSLYSKIPSVPPTPSPTPPPPPSYTQSPSYNQGPLQGPPMQGPPMRQSRNPFSGMRARLSRHMPTTSSGWFLLWVVVLVLVILLIHYSPCNLFGDKFTVNDGFTVKDDPSLKNRGMFEDADIASRGVSGGYERSNMIRGGGFASQHTTESACNNSNVPAINEALISSNPRRNLVPIEGMKSTASMERAMLSDGKMGEGMCCNLNDYSAPCTDHYAYRNSHMYNLVDYLPPHLINMYPPKR